MLIDWFTVGAQALNFLVLVWLLKRFLYRPIVAAIDEREARIAAQLQLAEAIKAEASQERETFHRKNRELEEQRGTILRQVEQDARAERETLLNQAQQEFQSLRSRLQETLREEQESVSREFGARVQGEIFAVARKVLADLAVTGIEEHVVKVFVRRLREAKDEEWEGVISLLRASPSPVRVRSGLELTEDQRGVIERALREVCLRDCEVSFETAPDLIVGIELVANGHKIGWSVADYLEVLEKTTRELLEKVDATNGEATS